MFSFLPEIRPFKLTDFAERKIMDGAMLYYKMPKIILAPNQELLDILTKGTSRSRDFDAARRRYRNFFARQNEPSATICLRFGFVGRLRAEKNVRLLADLEKELLEAGKTNFKFLIVGEGNEHEWLEKNMKTAEFTGFLDGEQLSEAYANMDVFVFPSETDAFGNVVQEANASGVPAIVTDQGGPKFIVQHGETGFIAENLDDFVKFSIELMDNPEKLATMKKASREFALSCSWDAVFEAVYDAYAEAIDISEEQKQQNIKN